MPKEPNILVANIFNLGRITAVGVDSVKLENGDSQTFVVLANNSGERVKAIWNEVKNYIDVSISYGSVANLLPKYYKQMVDYRVELEHNVVDLAAFKILKQERDKL